MRFNAQVLIERTAAERSRDFFAWAAACARNRERMQKIGEAVEAVVYQMMVGGEGEAALWLYADSDGAGLHAQELLRPFTQGAAWHDVAGAECPTCFVELSDGLTLWLRVKEFA